MARLENVLYRSTSTSIIDLLAYGREEISLNAASVAFVRSGYFARRSDTGAVVDANYSVIGGEGDCLLSDTCKHICTCTIISCGGTIAPASLAGCALVSSRVFLLQAKLLSDARFHRGDPESDAFALLRDIHSASENRQACAHSRLVTEIRRLINDSASRRISLEAIGRELYMSPFSVSRLFHRETGLRLRDYALRLRLRKALNLLMHSPKNLTGIAMDLGFYDEPHFSKAFRSEFGVSPHSVRKYCTKSDFC